MSNSIVGIDIGGANLKAANLAGKTEMFAFPLWKQPNDLPSALQRLLAPFGSVDRLAVTMTGELCDCFETKRLGVQAILDAVSRQVDPERVQVWSTDDEFISVAKAKEHPFEVAAANWHALATYCGHHFTISRGLLLDIGSTTTDIIPIENRQADPNGYTDVDRLKTGELVYTGVRRTPVCALLPEDVMAELFATSLDVYIVLGLIPEDPENTDTADGRPATKKHAHGRLARMLGGDTEIIDPEITRLLASRANRRQRNRICHAIERVLEDRDPPEMILFAGSGDFLAKLAWSDVELLFELNRTEPIPTLSLTEKWGASLSTVACAYAVAQLSKERR